MFKYNEHIFYTITYNIKICATILQEFSLWEKNKTKQNKTNKQTFCLNEWMINDFFILFYNIWHIIPKKCMGYQSGSTMNECEKYSIKK